MNVGAAVLAVFVTRSCGFEQGIPVSGQPGATGKISRRVVFNQVCADIAYALTPEISLASPLKSFRMLTNAQEYP
eukprot:2265399-Pleurochrysis_carterae.AAC.1